MKKTVSKLVSAVDRISYVGGGISGMVLLAAIAVLIILEIVLRFVFNTSTLLCEEYSSYFFVGFVYLAAADTLRTDSHIKINMVVRRLSPKRQLVLSRFISLLNLPVFVILSWRGWHIVLDNYRYDVLAATVISTPLYIPMLVIPLGFTILAMQGIVEVIRAFTLSESKDRLLTESSKK